MHFFHQQLIENHIHYVKTLFKKNEFENIIKYAKNNDFYHNLFSISIEWFIFYCTSI